MPFTVDNITYTVTEPDEPALTVAAVRIQARNLDTGNSIETYLSYPEFVRLREAGDITNGVIRRAHTAFLEQAVVRNARYQAVVSNTTAGSGTLFNIEGNIELQNYLSNSVEIKKIKQEFKNVGKESMLFEKDINELYELLFKLFDGHVDGDDPMDGFRELADYLEELATRKGIKIKRPNWSKTWEI